MPQGLNCVGHQIVCNDSLMGYSDYAVAIYDTWQLVCYGYFYKRVEEIVYITGDMMVYYQNNQECCYVMMRKVHF